MTPAYWTPSCPPSTKPTATPPDPGGPTPATANTSSSTPARPPGPAPHETCRISFVAFDAPVSGHRRPRHAATKEIIMSSTVLSLDGFVAGPNESLDNGLGDGGERLHEWALD